MSSIQERAAATIFREEYIPWSDDWANIAPVVKDSVRGRLVDTSTKCLLALGGVPIVVGIATGIWPVALAGLGPLLLAWLDINQQRRKRRRWAG